MIIEWPHDIDCPACLDSGECNCWVKEAKAHVKRLEFANATLLEALGDISKKDFGSEYADFVYITATKAICITEALEWTIDKSM